MKVLCVFHAMFYIGETVRRPETGFLKNTKMSVRKRMDWSAIAEHV